MCIFWTTRFHKTPNSMTLVSMYTRPILIVLMYAHMTMLFYTTHTLYLLDSIVLRLPLVYIVKHVQVGKKLLSNILWKHFPQTRVTHNKSLPYSRRKLQPVHQGKILVWCTIVLYQSINIVVMITDGRVNVISQIVSNKRVQLS